MTSVKKSEQILKLAKLLLASKSVIAFTGAGISVASGIPTFRGENGIWSHYDSRILELDNYYRNPQKCWKVIKEIFYETIEGVKPNPGHYALAELQEMGLLKSIFTQNIDNLHQEAGSKNVYEFHGNTKYFVCSKCSKKYPIRDIDLLDKYPKCPDCSGLVKPDFVFFSEQLPQKVLMKAYTEAEEADLMLVIGCSGEVYPANQIPFYAKQAGCKIVEINPQKTPYSDLVSDFRISGTSQETLQETVDSVKEMRRKQ